MNICETGRQIAIKFNLKQYCCGGKAALGFGPDRIRTLVSVATDSSHRVIMGETTSSRFLNHDQILFILTGNNDIHKSLNEFQIRPDPTIDYRVCCP